MKAHLTRRYRFSASHRLHSAAFSAEENQRVYGKCNNPYGHGHNYVLSVTVSGPVNQSTGMVCDLTELDTLVEREVLQPFGHSNLNTLVPFVEAVPTTENLAMEIYRRLRAGFRRARVDKVRLDETMLNSFEYAGGAEVRD